MNQPIPLLRRDGMISLEEARAHMSACLQPLPTESVALAAAHGRFLGQDVASPVDLPPFDNSAMDGYAVRCADMATASADSPVALRLLATTPAGEVFQGTLEAGMCVRLFTGSALPAGADAVVMQEDTRTDPGRPGEVWILDKVKPWENLRFRGEDVKRGAPVLAAGECLNALRVGLLGALGLGSVNVRRQAVVGLLATGSELIEPGAGRQEGRIFESNRFTLAPLLIRAGAKPRVYPLVRDTLAETCAALELAFSECDAVVTTGGVSVGDLDFVKEAFGKLGGDMEFWRVAIRPGKPFLFGRLRDRFLFGLPGNPVSAVVTFLLLVRPALLRCHGAKEVELPSLSGVLAEPMSNLGERRHFVRVMIQADGTVQSAGAQASHLLSSMALANGLMDMPPKTNWPAGTPVRVLRFEA